MNVRKMMVLSGAIASLVLGAGAAMAEEVAPLAAGGPAAASEGPLGASTVEIAGAIVVVTIAGIVTLDSDNDTLPPTSSTTSSGT